MAKPILCLDFDGVIHAYDSGWQGADVIADPPVAGAMAFIAEAAESFRVAIHSSRSHQPGGIFAMQDWLRSALGEAMDDAAADRLFAEIEWPTEKPPAMVSLDDRALTFTGQWPAVETLLAFRPWNKAG